jgi:hypothetical protein
MITARQRGKPKTQFGHSLRELWATRKHLSTDADALNVALFWIHQCAKRTSWENPPHIKGHAHATVAQALAPISKKTQRCTKPLDQSLRRNTNLRPSVDGRGESRPATAAQQRANIEKSGGRLL